MLENNKVHWQNNNLSDLFNWSNEYNRLNELSLREIDFATKQLFSIFDLCFHNYANTFPKIEVNNIQKETEISKFIRYTNDILSEEDKFNIVNSIEFGRLITLNPLIEDNEIIEEMRFGKSGDASNCHQELNRSYENFENQPTKQKDIIRKLCRLLYIVRCNLMHGLKTPYGIDKEKAGRDKQVCEVILPILKLLFHYYFNFPNHRIVSYGLLKEIISENKYEEIKWGKCRVFGEILKEKDLNYYIPGLGSEFDAEVGIAKKAINFDRLDHIEGKRYKRILVPVRIDDKYILCNIYKKNQ